LNQNFIYLEKESKEERNREEGKRTGKYERKEEICEITVFRLGKCRSQQHDLFRKVPA